MALKWICDQNFLKYKKFIFYHIKEIMVYRYCILIILVSSLTISKEKTEFLKY